MDGGGIEAEGGGGEEETPPPASVNPILKAEGGLGVAGK